MNKKISKKNNKSSIKFDNSAESFDIFCDSSENPKSFELSESFEPSNMNELVKMIKQSKKKRMVDTFIENKKDLDSSNFEYSSKSCETFGNIQDSRLDESNTTIELSISDIKSDMHKIIKIADMLEKKTSYNKLKIDSLEKEIYILKSELEQISSSNLANSNSRQYSSQIQSHLDDSKILNSACESLNDVSSSETDTIPSFLTNTSSKSINTSLSSDNTHVREDFEKFKNEVAITINQLANKIDTQIKLFISTMSGLHLHQRNC